MIESRTNKTSAKDCLRKMLKSFITPISLLYNYQTSTLINTIRINFYSIWISKQFPHIGKNVFFFRKLTLVGAKYIQIKDSTTFGYGCILTAIDRYNSQKFSPNISIGTDSHFGEYNHITAINSIIIGNGVLTGRWITITDNAHGKSNYEDLCLPPHKRDLYSKGPVIIGDKVWIGDKVSIMPNVKIGESCIIAANSVVTKDIPPFCIAAGSPAKVIKKIKPL